MTNKLTIIGLGQIGTSIGLALADEKDQIERVGHDLSITTARQAQKMDAIDNAVINLHDAVQDADIVVLAIPFDAVRETLELIAEDLKEGAVVLDTSPLQVEPLAWAAELMPAERFFISFTPFLNPAYLHETGTGIESAHAALFKKSMVSIACPPKTPSDAVQLAHDFSVLLGARPIFGDAYESDGLNASVNLLPKLAAAALIHAIIEQPGWMDARKSASRAFAMSTEVINHLDDSTEFGLTHLSNRENVVRVLNDLIRALAGVRDLVANEDAVGLKDYLKKARDGRENWMVERLSQNYETALPTPELPTQGDRYRRLFGIPQRKNKDQKK